MQLLAETGSDLTKWPSEQHFASWLGVSPAQSNSGKRNRNTRKKGKPKAGQIFRIIAQGMINSKDIAIGSFGRRLRGRKGPRIAIKAMARKIAILYWRVMVKGLDYAEQGIRNYEEQLLLNKMKILTRLTKELESKISENMIIT